MAGPGYNMYVHLCKMCNNLSYNTVLVKNKKDNSLWRIVKIEGKNGSLRCARELNNGIANAES